MVLILYAKKMYYELHTVIIHITHCTVRLTWSSENEDSQKNHECPNQNRNGLNHANKRLTKILLFNFI